jgi:hypothetical protein
MRSSRREFIARGGALAGALTLTGAGSAAAHERRPAPPAETVPTPAEPAVPPPPAAAEAPAAATAPGLTDARRTTYRALAETVVTEPGMRLTPAAADTAAAGFAAAYAAWPAERQRRADQVLDALERSAGRSFAKLDGRGRSAHLRTCAKPTDDEPIGGERERLDLAEQALALAAVAVGPSGNELDRPMVTV